MNNKKRIPYKVEVVNPGMITHDSFEHLMIVTALGFPEEFDTDSINKIITYRVPNVEYKRYVGIKVKEIYTGPVILIDVKLPDEGVESLYPLIGKLKENENYLEWRCLDKSIRLIFKYSDILLGENNA